MALSLTSRYTDTGTYANTNYTSGSFTPSNNVLLVATITCQFGANTSNIPTCSGGGLTWTPRKSIGSTGATTHGVAVAIYTAPVTTGASMTLSSTITGDAFFCVEVVEVTGYDATTPIGATGSLDNTASGSWTNVTFNLNTAPASTSYVYSATCTGATSGNTSPWVSAGAGWTLSTSGGVNGLFSFGTEYETGTTSTTVTWANLSVGDTYGPQGSTLAAIEIIAAATSGPTPADCSMLFQPNELLKHPTTLDTNQLHRYDVAPPETKVGNPQLDTGPWGAGSLGVGTLGALIPGDAVTPAATPADCSFLFQASANLVHPRTLDTNQPLNDAFAGRAGVTPTQLAFWFQPPTLGPIPKSTQNTNQSFDSAYAAWSATNPTPSTYWLQPTPDLQRHIPTIYTAQSFVCNPTIGPPVPGWYTQAPALLNHPQTLDTNQPKDDFFSGWANTAPTSIGFWTQGQNLLEHPPTIDTNQSVVSYQVQAEPAQDVAFWTQAQDLLRHPVTLDTNQGFDAAYRALIPTPSDASFWLQPPDLLRHPATIDTNQPFNAGFAGQANVTPTQFGFWRQAEDLLHHPATIDTRLQFEFNPPPSAATTSDCSFLFQPNVLLNHPQTVDTNQSLDDTFFGWQQNVTPTAFGFWTEAPSLLQHPATVDTNQPFVFNPPPPAGTSVDCSFLYQPSALLNHPSTLDTNQPLDDTFNGRAGVTPSALGFWTQAPDLIRHPVTIDTNQSRVSYQDKATPASFGFWIQASVLSRHTNTIDTNQSFVFNPPTPGATPSAFWWYEPPALLRHPPHLDTNQSRLVSQVGATPSSLGWWRQAENLLKHPVTLDTRQAFIYFPPLPPPNGWFVQPQVLLRHPVPFVLGGQYSFALLPPVIQVNRLIKVYFFD